MARIDPYAVAIYHNKCIQIQKTDDMKRNVKYVVQNLKRMIGTADFPGMLGRPELPVRLIVLPEAFCTGWADEFCYLDNETVENIANNFFSAFKHKPTSN